MFYFGPKTWDDPRTSFSLWTFDFQKRVVFYGPFSDPFQGPVDPPGLWPWLDSKLLTLTQSDSHPLPFIWVGWFVWQYATRKSDWNTLDFDAKKNMVSGQHCPFYPFSVQNTSRFLLVKSFSCPSRILLFAELSWFAGTKPSIINHWGDLTETNETINPFCQIIDQQLAATTPLPRTLVLENHPAVVDLPS